MTSISGKFLILAALLCLCRDAQGQCTGQWADGLSTLPGLDGSVYAMTVFNDGSGDALYVGGNFTFAGDTPAANIAKWNGTSWSALGSGMSGSSQIDDEVYALTVFDDGGGPALYAGGEFNTAGGVSANRIAKWDGKSWSALGSGLGSPNNPIVRALAVFDDGGGPALYAGGDFTSAGDVSASHIAKWDGKSWSDLGLGMSGSNPDVYALTVFDDGGGPALYAGGDFTTAGGVSANRIAKWNGSTWSALGSGMSGSNPDVYALTVFDDGGGLALYAGGYFFTAGSVNAKHIAKWDGLSWSPVGSGVHGPYIDPDDAYVFALTVFDDGDGPALYVGGWFLSPGKYIAKWDGTSWSGLQSGTSGGGVSALAVCDDGGRPALYAGGDFFGAGGVGAKRIAKWDGATWSALGSGMNNYVDALTVFDDGGGPAMYAGGSFISAGGVGAKRIAKWDLGATGHWSALGSGMNDYVRALAVFDDGGGPALYAAGGFTTAGGVSANRIAKWDGKAWSALAGGTGGSIPSVSALTVFDDGGGSALYAGGWFTTAGGVSANRIAKWNGVTWSALGTGMSGEYPRVDALAVFDDGGGPALHAGGDFITAGGMSANHIAKWDGASWSALGGGVNGSVSTLGVFDDGGGPALYAGGVFTIAGGVSANHIAKWDGANWSALGSGMNSPVYALEVFDDGDGPALYAGGEFLTAGGGTTNPAAKWDGATWSALGAGTNNDVYDLTVFDDGGGPALYAGGDFTKAGGSISPYFARWSTHAQADAAGFAADMTGPTAAPGCKPYDFDCDGDVDLHDYPRFLFHFERE